MYRLSLHYNNISCQYVVIIDVLKKNFVTKFSPHYLHISNVTYKQITNWFWNSYLHDIVMINDCRSYSWNYSVFFNTQVSCLKVPGYQVSADTDGAVDRVAKEIYLVQNRLPLHKFPAQKVGEHYRKFGGHAASMRKERSHHQNIIRCWLHFSSKAMQPDLEMCISTPSLSVIPQMVRSNAPGRKCLKRSIPPASTAKW